MNISVTTCFYYARLMDMTHVQLDSLGFIPGLDFTSKLLPGTEKSDQTMLPWQFSSAKYET